jgi:hypothetical protein
VLFQINKKNNYITNLNKLYADANIILSVMSSEECLGKIKANLIDKRRVAPNFNIEKCI